jgi:predicted TIM-barrel fold metal-dependent hydrolase
MRISTPRRFICIGTSLESPVEGSLPHLVNYLGANKILWTTDYPHGDGFFPRGAPKMIAEKLPESMRRKVLAESAMQFTESTKRSA